MFTLLLCFPAVVFGQIADDFSDGDFTNNPVWFGDTALFTVNATGQLQTNGPAFADTALLATQFPSDFSDTVVWQWYWKMQFDPSNNNYSRVYLSSSDSSFLGEGYFLRLGENGSADALKLYRYSGSSEVLLVTGSSTFAQSPELRVKVTRYPDATWAIESALPSQGFVPEATVVDNAILSSAFFGVWCKYTSSNSTKFYFDDVLVDSAFYDLTPPLLLSASAENSTQVRVTFNEPLDLQSAESTANYTVSSGVGAPVLASLDLLDSGSVVLTFGSPLPQAQLLTLTVAGVQDVHGNTMLPQSAEFTFYDLIPASFRDLVINELMADPSPTVGLPEAEYIEIYNASAAYISLDGFFIKDPSTTVALPNEIIAPGEYILLCRNADTLSFNSFGRIIALSTMPTLNNDGDEITLLLDSTVIDQVIYTLAWYGSSLYSSGGYSLEQINPLAPCSGQLNWRASTAALGGTPGTANSILNTQPDITAPVVTEVRAFDVDQLSIEFSEPLDTSQVLAANFSGSFDVNQVMLGNGNTQVTLKISPALVPGNVYEVGIQGLFDCAGNPSIDTLLPFGLGVSPQPFDLVITELYPIPEESSPLPFAEFIEIYNRSGRLISTEGLSVADRTIDSDLPDALIFPDEFVIICSGSNTSLFSPFGRVISVSSLPSLNNTGDQISVFQNLNLVDQVTYADTWFRDAKKSDGGWTLERINTEDLCGVDSNWRASIDDLQGTPGRKNSVETDMLVPTNPTISSMRFVSENAIAVVIDQRLDTLITPTVELNGAPVPFSFNALGNSLTLSASESLQRGVLHQVRISNSNTCDGKTLAVLSVESYLPDVGDIIINEVLFNPRGSGSDFVELFNTAEYEIDLFGWALGYLDGNDSLRFNTLPTPRWMIQPQGYALLHEDREDILNNYPFAVAEHFIKTDLPSYPNSQGSVMVFDGTKVLMERFDYREEMHLALIADPDGVSLERLNPQRPASDDGNWHSAASTDNYGTPGYQNSQYAEAATPLGEVSLSSEYISPDGDGYQDHVNVIYQFGSPGNVLKVSVYNTTGVLIREITSNHLAGTTGAITWDGVTDDGLKAATGIHLIVVEAFDIDNKKQLYRLPVVVATKF